MLSDLWRNITENLGSYLGTVVVTALVSFASWPFRRLRAASGKPVTVYLASTMEDLARHEAAIEERMRKTPVVLVRDPGKADREKAIGNADMFIGLYAWVYGEPEDDGRSAADHELDLAVKRFSDPRLKLWMVFKGEYWSLDHADPDRAEPHSRIFRLRTRVQAHHPGPITVDTGKLSGAVLDAVRVVRRGKYPQSLILDNLLDARSFVIGAVVAITASLYFAIRIAVAGAPGSLPTVLLLSLACGAVAYLVRFATCTLFLR